jgi:hypothetical protein
MEACPLWSALRTFETGSCNAHSTKHVPRFAA